jgi:hypothetical protein
VLHELTPSGDWQSATVGSAANVTPENPRVPAFADVRASVLQKELQDELAKPTPNQTNVAAIQTEIRNLQGGMPAVGRRYEYPKAEGGYEYKPGGTQRPIEGGPKDITVQNQERMRAALESADLVQEQVAKAKRATDYFSTGLIGSAAMNVPGSAAYDLRQVLESIKSNIGFTQLRQMREESVSGASGLGQLSHPELDNLQKALSSLDQKQSPQQLRENLDNINRHYRILRGAIAKQYKIQLEDFPSSSRKGTMGATGSWGDASSDPLGIR